jgi:hypothetical protein
MHILHLKDVSRDMRENNLIRTDGSYGITLTMLFQLQRLFYVKWYDRMISQGTEDHKVVFDFKVIPGIHLKGTRKTTKALFRMVCVPVQVRTRHFPNKSQKRNGLSQAFYRTESLGHGELCLLSYKCNHNERFLF